ncbi:MAG: DUF2147 domain-containing protein [Hyphomonas sp.]|nr:DUF2147 domain-containing protein [Hyphomonas sp.]
MKRMLVAAALASLFAGPAAADPFDVFGTFKLPDGDSHVQIADCGDGSPCGKIVWINAKDLPSGMTPAEVKNPKGEKILGYKLLQGFARKAKDWRGGKIHDPMELKTYDSRLKRLTDGSLEVKGCIGPVCQTQIWKPAS